MGKKRPDSVQKFSMIFQKSPINKTGVCVV